MKANLPNRASVRFGGFQSERFTTNRGVPQEDCLSPMLFVIALNQLLVNISNDKSISGVKVNAVKRCVMAHADDLLLLTKNDRDL